jgi:capsular polysaccharide biosynthesis protein
MPLRKNMSHRAMMQELMASYERDGKIGNIRPKNKQHALEIANAIAYRMKREGKGNKRGR